MFEVRRAIHVRTGQRAAVEAIDAWLERHQVESIPFGDVYEACVHLLMHSEQIPELVLIGADWLADDEFNFVGYVRQTWPRAAVVVYGGTCESPTFDLLPLMVTCRTEAALQKLLAETPAELAQRMWAGIAPLEVSGAAPGTPPVQREICGLPPLRSTQQEGQPQSGQSDRHGQPAPSAGQPPAKRSRAEARRSARNAEKRSGPPDTARAG